MSDSVTPPADLGPDAKPAWRVEVPFGRSSPLVVGDLCVLTASDADGLIVQARGAKDGAVRWEHRVARARADDRYAGNDSASPTPASDGEAVYAFFPEVGLVAIGLDGAMRWTRALDAFDSFYGMSSSPIVVGGRVVLQCDQESGSFLLAVDAATGEVAWRTDRPGIDVSWSTPVLRAVDGAPAEVVAFGSRCVLGYALADGKPTWRGDALGSGPVCSPVVAGDRVYVCAPNHAEEPFPEFATVAATYDKDGDGKLTRKEVEGTEIDAHFGWVDDDEDDVIVAAEWAVARDAMNNKDYGLVAFSFDGDGAVHELWRQRRALPEIATPIVYDGVLYALKHGGVLTALDAATGAVLRRGRLGDVVEDFNASPIAAHGRLFAASTSGKLVVVGAGPDWEVRSVRDFEEPIDATPALGADGAFYVRTRAALYCFR